MSDFSWDEVQDTTQRTFFKFNEVGDKVVGTVAGKRQHSFNDAEKPSLLLDIDTDDGEAVTVTMLVDLLRKAKQQRLEAGDHVEIELADLRKIQGRPIPMKVFNVVKDNVGEAF